MHVPHFPTSSSFLDIPTLTQDQRCMELRYPLLPPPCFCPEEDIDILHEKLLVLANYLLIDCVRLD